MTRRAKFVLAVFIAIQAFDAVLTYVGVTRGLAPEANPLIVGLAQYVGFMTALGSLKLLAVCGALVLAYLGRVKLLVLAILLYLGFAVLPWMFVFGIL